MMEEGKREEEGREESDVLGAEEIDSVTFFLPAKTSPTFFSCIRNCQFDPCSRRRNIPLRRVAVRSDDALCE